MNNTRTLPVSVGAVTETGQRQENQDHMSGFLSPFGSVYIVADGMGGHKGGAEASRMVVEGFRRHLLALPASTPIADGLSLAARLTNVELLEKGKSGDPALAGMGSTVAIAVIRTTEHGMDLITGHAGDSRVYRHRGGQLTLLTRDHTQVQWMVDRQMLNEEEARKHPDSSTLTRAMGQSTDLTIDVSDPTRLLDGDEVLMCSDGLSGFVGNEEINRILNQYPEPTACAKELVRLALAAGSNDNITVQCLRIGSVPQAVLPVPAPAQSVPNNRLTMPATPAINPKQFGPPRQTAPQQVVPQAQPLMAPPVHAPALTPPARSFGSPTFLSGIAAGLGLAALLGAGFFAVRNGLFWNPFAAKSTEVALRLEGSTTIGDELAPALVKEFLLHDGVAAKDIEQNKSSCGKACVQTEIIASRGGKKETYVIVANGSAKAFEALQAKRADIGMSSRLAAADEAGKLRAAGDRSPCCEHVVALDGIAIVVNEGNTVRALDRTQLADIFRGKITDWSGVGGKPGPIQPYVRNKDSGTERDFASMVLGKDTSIVKGATVKSSGDEIAAAVSADPGGIGYIAIAQIKGVKGLAISDGPGLPGLVPSLFTVASEEYVLSRRLYLYSTAAPSASARRFIDFAVGQKGRETVKNVGFVVPPDTDFEQVKPLPGTSASYLEATKDKLKMNVKLRFEFESADLDGAGIAEVARAASKLTGKSGVLVLGLADDKEHCKSTGLAEKRAIAVQNALKDNHVESQTKWFCEGTSVDNSKTEEGRAKNRRVEIWVSR